MGALAGLITVAAITVRHATTLVQRYRQLEATAAAEDRVSLAMRGAQERLVPTLVTALGTAAFALPFIIMGDVAGLEIMRPMAVFILGSLISSTVAPAVRPAEHLPAARAESGIRDRDIR